MSVNRVLAKSLAVSFIVPVMAFSAPGVDDVGGSASGVGVTGGVVGGAAVTAGTVTFTGNEATMSPRFFRSGQPGDSCSTFSSGNFQYISVPFNTDGSGVLSATVDPQTCGTSVYVTFHVGAFNPADICGTGYQWSYGSSQSYSESFSVPANTAMTMVVSGVANAPGVVCGPVTYSLDGTAVGAAAIPVPVNNPIALTIMAGLMGMVGWRFRNLRRAT